MEERYQPLKIPAVKISENKFVDKNVSIDRQNGRKGKRKIHCRILKATGTKCAKGKKSNKSYRE
jgi:hypothetical protein